LERADTCRRLTGRPAGRRGGFSAADAGWLAGWMVLTSQQAGHCRVDGRPAGVNVSRAWTVPLGGGTSF